MPIFALTSYTLICALRIFQYNSPCFLFSSTCRSFIKSSETHLSIKAKFETDSRARWNEISAPCYIIIRHTIDVPCFLSFFIAQAELQPLAIGSKG